MLKKLLTVLLTMGSSATLITSGTTTIVEEEVKTYDDYVHCYNCDEIIGEYEDETHEWCNIYGDTTYMWESLRMRTLFLTNSNMRSTCLLFFFFNEINIPYNGTETICHYYIL